MAGCSTAPLQSTGLRDRLPAAAPVHQVSGVPFIEQKFAHCGPASLAMVLNFQGRKVSADEIAEQTFTPGAEGSFQQDLISSARRQGFLAIPVSGFEALLTEVGANHPVIVFENLGVSWYQQWHYAVVTGYDLTKQELTMHSGAEANKVQGLRRFEKDWMLGDYWGLVVLKPGELAKSADEMTHVKAAAALEQLRLNDPAVKSYLAILERWPESLTSAIGIANIKYAEGDFKESARFLTRATESHPNSAAAWHNLAIAQVAAKQMKEARKSASVALDLANAEEKVVFRKSLKSAIGELPGET